MDQPLAAATPTVERSIGASVGATLGRSRLRAVALGLLVALVVSLGFVAAAPAAMADELYDFRPVTYNMQGSSADRGSIDKWRRDVEPLLANHDVVALQEAGTPPSSADPVGTFDAGNGYEVETFKWQLGSSTRGRRGLHQLGADRPRRQPRESCCRHGTAAGPITGGSQPGDRREARASVACG